MEYSVPTKNRFLVPLSDDEDLIEYSHRQEEEKTKKKAESDKLKKDKSSQKSAKGKANKKINVVQQADQKSKQGDNVNTKKDVENRLPRSANQTKQTGDRDKPERNVKFSKDARDGDDRRQDRQDRRNRDVEKSSPFSDFREKPERPEGDDRRGRGRGRGGFGRGGRGGRGRGGSEDGFDRNQRTYDRRSGSVKTGVKPVEKREGGGSRNWGTMKDDEDGQNDISNVSEENIDWNATNDDNENKDPNEVPVDGTTEPVEGEGETEPKEEEVREMTLQEWKEKQSQQRAKPVYNLRKANEGVDKSQCGKWDKYHALEPKKKLGDDAEDVEDEDDDEYEYTHGRKVPVTNLIKVVIADPYGRGGGRGRGRGGRGRGGPGRGRGGERGGGGGGRGGDRFGGDRMGGRGGSKGDLPPAPDVNDKDSFPGLGDS